MSVCRAADIRRGLNMSVFPSRTIYTPHKYHKKLRGVRNKMYNICFKICGQSSAPLDMICGQRWKHRTIWTLGDKKTKCNPLWMVVDYLDLVSETAPTFKAITRSSSAPSVVLWHSCQFVSTQPDFQNTNLIISKWKWKLNFDQLPVIRSNLKHIFENLFFQNDSGIGTQISA